MNMLILGGSGFLSRFVAEEARKCGYAVTCVTRGTREAIPGVREIHADRNDVQALGAALRQAGDRYDAVIDCICFSAEQARADITLLPEFTDRIIVISTDSLYHPDFKRVPQDENGEAYMEDDSYGAGKRRVEQVFLEECPPGLRWTLFRPPHLYGPGSELGCFPMHTRQKDLLAHLRAGKPIRLVDGGEYLIQPLYAGDLAAAAVASAKNPKAENEIFCIAGPEAIPNRAYFTLLGDLLNLPVTIENATMDEFLSQRNDGYCYFCHRVYDLTKLKTAGLPVPATTLRTGLQQQIDALIALGR